MIQIFNHSHSLMHMNSSLLFSRLSGVTLAVLALMAASAQAQQAQRAEPAGKARAAAQAALTENEPAEDEYEATMPTVYVTGTSENSVTKGYIGYDQAEVTRNQLTIKETPQAVDVLDIQKNKNYGTNDLSSILEGNAASPPTPATSTATASAKAARCAAPRPTSNAWKFSKAPLPCCMAAAAAAA